MRREWTVPAAVIAAFLAGCAPDSTEFIAKYAEAECDFATRCYDPAILEFYGWSDVAECVDERGPEITGDADGCTYDKKMAKQCLKAMKDLACPSEGDPEVPEVCTQVFACTDGGDDTSVDTDT